MAGIRTIKFKARALVILSKLISQFNRRVEGITTAYNLRYERGFGRAHKLDIMQREGLKGAPCVLYMHGGGWSAFDKDVFRSTCKRLSNCGTLVFNCNHRLAPKFGILHMLEDAYAAFRYVVANAEKYGGDAGRIILAGDSSGAHILSMFLNRAIRDGDDNIVSRVAGCAFFYGVYDLETVRDTGFKNIGPYMNAFISPDTENYEELLREYSPIHLVNGKHPPAFISCGETDVLTASQSLKYIKALEENGVRVHSLIFPKECADAAHRFITYDDNPASVEAFKQFKNFLEQL